MLEPAFDLVQAKTTRSPLARRRCPGRGSRRTGRASPVRAWTASSMVRAPGPALPGEKVGGVPRPAEHLDVGAPSLAHRTVYGRRSSSPPASSSSGRCGVRMDGESVGEQPVGSASDRWRPVRRRRPASARSGGEPPMSRSAWGARWGPACTCRRPSRPGPGAPTLVAERRALPSATGRRRPRATRHAAPHDRTLEVHVDV